VLRGEWDFDGVVVSDWGAVRDRVSALSAGLDLEMPPNLGVSDTAIVAAVHDGTLDEKILDQAALRILRLLDRAQPSADPAVIDHDAHHRLARAAAADCAVLLKNDRDILPLRPGAGDTIAVIGELARTPRFQGAGSSQVNPARVEVPVDALRALVPAAVAVDFAAGYRLDGDDDEQMSAEAVDLAGRARTVVLFLGLPAGAESEGADRRHMDLPGNQTALLTRLAAVNTDVVVVLTNGSAVRLTPWDRHVPAVLETWLAGQAAGGAIADLLLGVANPSGKLAETLPHRLQDTPAYLNFPGEHGHVRYGEGIFVGYRGYDAVGRDVAYPFGHGLSYTTFAYHDLTVTVTGTTADDLAVVVTCTVVNTGLRPGKEVVQLYTGHPAGPSRELRAFAKVDITVGSREHVMFHLDARDLSSWSSRHRRWLLDGGTYTISVGASSRDLRLTATVDLPKTPVDAPLTGGSTLREWLADPAGAARLKAAIGVDADGKPVGVLADPESLTVLGDFPLQALAAFPRFGISQAAIAEVSDVA
jgi:beta-glucosidase